MYKASDSSFGRIWLWVLLCLTGSGVLLEVCLTLLPSNSSPGMIGSIPFLLLGGLLMSSLFSKGSQQQFILCVGTIAVLLCPGLMIEQMTAAYWAFTAVGLATLVGLALWSGTMNEALEQNVELQSSDDADDSSVPSDSTIQTAHDNLLVIGDFEPKLHDEDRSMVLQSWTRSRIQNEIDQLAGTFTVEFEAGARVVQYHIPISPSFCVIPEGWCEADDECCQVKFVQILSYGARLNIRRSGSVIDADSFQVNVLLSCSLADRSVA